MSFIDTERQIWERIHLFLLHRKKDKGMFIVHAFQRYIRNISYKLFADRGFMDSIRQQLDQIPESNGYRYYESYQTRIAIIADEFLYNSYKDVAHFVYTTPDNYKDVREQVDFLLVVSAWRGLHDEWRLMGTPGSEPNLKLHELISYYKEGGKKVVFYSKEDPPNYDHFLPIAQRCDMIFTSAHEKIENYKRDCGIDDVYPMKFGINPVYHNPIGTRLFPKRDEIIFSGSWVKKYPDRIKALGIIFDGVLSAGKKLRIIDRNYALDIRDFFFPHKYDRYISPSIPHESLQKTHKLYDWAININSVTDSRTMFANRVYELQAVGNLMLSNDSVGIEEQFKEVVIVHSKNDVKRALAAYTAEETYEHQMAGVRRVMTGETTFDRVGELLNRMRIDVNQPLRRVLVLMHNRTTELEKQFSEQTYPHKECMDYEEVTDEIWESCDMVAVWDRSCAYGRYYLEDMINGFKYTSCDYICKDSYYIGDVLEEGTEHGYVSGIRNIYAAVFWRECISRAELAEAVAKREITRKGGYSIDHFNLNIVLEENA